MTYLLDSNIFIQAKNLYYGMDFCPAFWDWLIEKNKAGIVFSIDKVADEISAGNDELTKWSEDNENLFRKTDVRVVEKFGAISDWAINHNYEQGAISIFLQTADFYLIAHTMAEDYMLVTHELPSNSVKKIKIPNVCIGLKLSFTTPYEMLRREKAKFVLEHARQKK
jgi:hypothetical protein